MVDFTSPQRQKIWFHSHQPTKGAVNSLRKMVLYSYLRWSKLNIIAFLPEVESSRTSLTSRTHFEVLGLGLKGQVLGLEASSP